MILRQTKWFQKQKNIINVDRKCHNRLKSKRDSKINPQNYNFNHFIWKIGSWFWKKFKDINIPYSGKFSRTKIFAIEREVCEICFAIFIFAISNERTFELGDRIDYCGFYFRDSVYSPRNRENKNPAKIFRYTVWLHYCFHDKFQECRSKLLFKSYFCQWESSNIMESSVKEK